MCCTYTQEETNCVSLSSKKNTTPVHKTQTLGQTTLVPTQAKLFTFFFQLKPRQFLGKYFARVGKISLTETTATKEFCTTQFRGYFHVDFCDDTHLNKKTHLAAPPH
jgi:hypothetical protein